MKKFSSLPSRRTAVKRKKRSKSDFARIYGSKQRVEFVKSLPCAACGIEGFSENAHVPPKGEAGTGYKADWRLTAPLCGPREDGVLSYIGCHRMYDRHRSTFYKWYPTFDIAKAAADTERLWLENKP
ncbi:MAG: hypothetical protein M3P26_16460 [Gemmatimonadota bacterium]|nr:hypothetical protein [Gemmatimonadota bacterium]